VVNGHRVPYFVLTHCDVEYILIGPRQASYTSASVTKQTHWLKLEGDAEFAGPENDGPYRRAGKCKMLHDAYHSFTPGAQYLTSQIGPRIEYLTPSDNVTGLDGHFHLTKNSNLTGRLRHRRWFGSGLRFWAALYRIDLDGGHQSWLAMPAEYSERVLNNQSVRTRLRRFQSTAEKSPLGLLVERYKAHPSSSFILLWITTSLPPKSELLLGTFTPSPVRCLWYVVITIMINNGFVDDDRPE